MFTSSGIEQWAGTAGLSPAVGGMIGGVGGGVAQAYATMGGC